MDGDSLPLDRQGHGTHVTSTIPATDNGLGLTGIAYGAKVMPIRVLDRRGRQGKRHCEGIEFATAHGADVINLSLTSTPTSRTAIRSSACATRSSTQPTRA